MWKINGWNSRCVIYIWWMGMFHRSACIWMRNSTSSKGSYLIWSLNKRQNYYSWSCWVCFFVILFLFIGTNNLNKILVIYVWNHLPYIPHDCITICHYYMNALNMYMYICIYILLKWFSFLFLTAFPIRLKNIYQVFMFAMTNCTTNCLSPLIKIWTILF
jgi:hypothetical protein